MTTIKEIAEKAGFSTATVSRVLSDDTEFSAAQETRDHILKIANALGYSAKHQSKTPQIKVALLYAVTPQKELEDIFYNNLRNTIITSAAADNIDLKLVRHVAEIEPDTAGFISIGLLSDDDLQQLSATNLNGIFMESNPDPHRYTSVEFNLNQIVNEAIDHFIDAGFSRIGFIGGPFCSPQRVTHPILETRRKAFESHMRELGLYHDADVFLGDSFSVESGYQIGNLIAEKYPNDDLPQAFFIASDPLAVGVLQAFNEHQIQIPKQTAIISVNDIDVAKYVSPPLTTYRLNVNELGKAAVTALRDTLNAPKQAKRTILLSSELIYRKSFLAPTPDVSSITN